MLLSTNLPIIEGADNKGIAFHGISAIFKGEVKIESPHFTLEIKKPKDKKLKKIKEEGIYCFGGILPNNDASG